MVSIPYERERTCEPKDSRAGHRGTNQVSIPYERERTCERFIYNPETGQYISFQFPTNGKVHVNSISTGFLRQTLKRWFQFPTNGKVHVNLEDTAPTFQLPEEFQFPTNGKGHVNLYNLYKEVHKCVYQFQFPTNGKGHVNERNRIGRETT